MSKTTSKIDKYRGSLCLLTYIVLYRYIRIVYTVYTRYTFFSRSFVRSFVRFVLFVYLSFLHSTNYLNKFTINTERSEPREKHLNWRRRKKSKIQQQWLAKTNKIKCMQYFSFIRCWQLWNVARTFGARDHFHVLFYFKRFSYFHIWKEESNARTSQHTYYEANEENFNSKKKQLSIDFIILLRDIMLF